MVPLKPSSEDIVVSLTRTVIISENFSIASYKHKIHKYVRRELANRIKIFLTNIDVEREFTEIKSKKRN